jgi:hypothetical protein
MIVWQRADGLRCVAAKSPRGTRWNIRVTDRSRIVRHRAYRCLTRALREAHAWRDEFRIRNGRLRL